MVDLSPAPWPSFRGAVIPGSSPSAHVGNSIASIVSAAGQDRSVPVIVASLPGPRDLEFSAVVSPVSLATLTALLRGGSLQQTNRRYRGAIASRSWPS